VKRPDRVTLSGRFARLEPIEERHRDDLLAAAAQDPATFRYLFTDLSHGASVWPAYLADALKPEYVSWATVDASTGRAIGSTRFLDIAPEHGRLEIGWTWIAPSH
jgi:RimJ/RimL family protein N-acetyltransferase